MNQEWEKAVLQICKREGLEIIPGHTLDGRSAFIFYRSEPLRDTVTKKIRETVPIEIPIEFKYKEKPSTLPAIGTLLLVSGARRPPQFKIEGKHLVIDIYDLEVERVDRLKIDTIVEQDGYFKSWTVNVDGQELYDMNLVGRRLALEIQGNKKRDQVLTDNDVTDLRISLETCNSVDDFLKTLEA